MRVQNEINPNELQNVEKEQLVSGTIDNIDFEETTINKTVVKKGKNKVIIIVLLAAIVLGTIALGLVFSYKNSSGYKYIFANKLMVAMEYKEAAAIFKTIPDYMDSTELYQVCNRHLLYKYIQDNGTENKNEYKIKVNDSPEQVYICAVNEEIVIDILATGGTWNNPKDNITNKLKLYIPLKGDVAKFDMDFDSNIYYTVLFSEMNIGGEKRGSGEFKVSNFNENTKLKFTKTISNDSGATDFDENEIAVSGIKKLLKQSKLGIKIQDLGFTAVK